MKGANLIKISIQRHGAAVSKLYRKALESAQKGSLTVPESARVRRCATRDHRGPSVNLQEPHRQVPASRQAGQVRASDTSAVHDVPQQDQRLERPRV